MKCLLLSPTDVPGPRAKMEEAKRNNCVIHLSWRRLRAGKRGSLANTILNAQSGFGKVANGRGKKVGKRKEVFCVILPSVGKALGSNLFGLVYRLYNRGCFTLHLPRPFSTLHYRGF